MNRDTDLDDDRAGLCAYPGCRRITPFLFCTRHRIAHARLTERDCECGSLVDDDPRETQRRDER
jgi:hypothetical protein